MSETRSIIVKIPESTAMRSDIYIASIENISRSQIKTRCKNLIVNKKRRKFSFIVQNNDQIEFQLTDNVYNIIQPENIYLRVLFENKRVIVINKKQGMVVHPGAGNFSGTLVNALLARHGDCNLTSNATTLPRPFIVHRLDKDTSGVIIAAWDVEALEFLQRQFRERKVKKRYIAITCGTPPTERGIINAPLARNTRLRTSFAVLPHGKPAITRYKVLSRLKKNDGSVYSLVRLAPKTGRTHQLRVHLKHIGCPILGDPVYNSRDRHFPNATLALHARRLTILLPNESSPSTFKAHIPIRIKSILNALLP